jgi:hypothetical protein
MELAVSGFVLDASFQKNEPLRAGESQIGLAGLAGNERGAQHLRV